MDQKARMQPDQIEELLGFFTLAERLKTELRHSWLSDGRQESVAEHCWMMAMMAILIAPHLENEVDLHHVLLMVLVHDICETKVGDIPFFEVSDRKDDKYHAEAQAMKQISEMFSDHTGLKMSQLWHEFEDGKTLEAKFARALDHLEVQHQHNLAAIDTWESVEYDLVYTKTSSRCSHDAFLMDIAKAIEAHAEQKMIDARIDVEAIRKRSVSRPSTQRCDRNG